MTDFDIEYADAHELEELLQSVARPGGFCTHGRVFVPMPIVEVEGVGMLSFPVPDSQVRSLVGLAERAPYGKGTETLVDTSVRDCRQIDAARIRLEGRVWADTLRGVLDTVAAGLGCPAGRLDAKPYKLLIYEPGGFFSAHRDTEKADGMIATLSITLPSAGTGGELVVRHLDQEISIDMSASEPSELAFAAFYADCVHETRPIREGWRLSLVFNLCVRRDDKETPRQPPDYSDRVRSIANQLVAWQDGEYGPDKLVWLLEHDYSEAGLSLDALKNADAAKAEVLKSAAKLADCELHAAVVHIKEEGPAEYIGDGYFDEFGGPSDDDVEMVEVSYGRYWLDGWASGDGERPDFGELSVHPGELLPDGALDDAEPDDKWVHEASGNEGVSLEWAYRHAALVIWPRRGILDTLARENVDRAVDWVGQRVEQDVLEASESIARLISVWPAEEPWQANTSSRDSEGRAAMLRLLGGVEDPELSLRFLREVLLLRYDGSENEPLPPVLRSTGSETTTRFLVDLVESRFLFHPDTTLELLLQLGESGDFDRKDTLGPSVHAALGALPESLCPLIDKHEVTWPPAPARKPIGTAELRSLFTLAWRCGLAEQAETAAAVIATHPGAIEPQRTIPAALEALFLEGEFAGTAAYMLLWRHAADSLLERSAKPPEAPRDWVVAAPVACDCELCTALKDFCADPVDQVRRFPLRTELRKHLHRQIDQHRLDMSHVTERQGRPYTLVCTKNRATHRRRLAEYAADVETMRSLTRLAPGGQRTKPVGAQRQRLLAAIAAADS
ncbi:MAG: 2OG-Fe(II) oxygenase [Gammaproteobacteria bacterium]|nr:2OG-Fe(II) oxygenase [Gammaproteobacteria bacterium]